MWTNDHYIHHLGIYVSSLQLLPWKVLTLSTLILSIIVGKVSKVLHNWSPHHCEILSMVMVIIYEMAKILDTIDNIKTKIDGYKWNL
jgi:hypothetical protein